MDSLRDRAFGLMLGMRPGEIPLIGNTNQTMSLANDKNGTKQSPQRPTIERPRFSAVRSVRSNRLLGGRREGNMETMTKATESVLADALRLDAPARAELAAELLASLDGPAEPDAASAWDEEIQRRVDALEAGTEKLESWETVKRRIASNILGR